MGESFDGEFYRLTLLPVVAHRKQSLSLVMKVFDESEIRDLQRTPRTPLTRIENVEDIVRINSPSIGGFLHL
jgi:hypothetical protein